jgi:hypothetical protein
MNSENKPVTGAGSKLVPASEDEIEAALGFDPLDYRHGFVAGVRWAEALHGITEKQLRS